MRRDGDALLFINPLRHATGDGPPLRLPLSRTDAPAVVAVTSGASGRSYGVDYRDVPVLAAYRPVIGSDWFLVANDFASYRVAQAEADACYRDADEWTRRSILTSTSSRPLKSAAKCS